MKRIALIVDAEGWAFDIEAKILKNKFKNDFEIDIFVSKDYDDDLFLILEKVKEYDMIHFFWRKMLLQFSSDEFKSKLKDNNYDYDDYLKVCNKISTGIYDHLFTDEENIDEFRNIFKKYSKMYYTCSKRLENIYSNLKDYPKPWGTIHDTYDEKLYNGGDKNRILGSNNYLTIGWIGNSNWNLKYKDFKGFHSVLIPVLDELEKEGYKIERHFADKNIKLRTNEEMPAYYQELDIVTILSNEEGTPRPIIEGMASGVPIITTDVGIAKEVFGPLQKELILGTRTFDNDEEIKSKLKQKIIELYNNRELLNKIKEENYNNAHVNSIDYLYNSYKKYFEDFLNNKGIA